MPIEAVSLTLVILPTEIMGTSFAITRITNRYDFYEESFQTQYYILTFWKFLLM